MFWERLMRLYDKIGSGRRIMLPMLGLGFCYSHVDLLYKLANQRYSSTLIFSDIVSAVVFLVGALLAWKFISLHRRGAFLCGTPVLAIMGMTLLYFATNEVASMVGAFLMSIGYTGIFLLWLELYGCLSPVNAAISTAGSCIVHVFLSAILQSMTDSGAFALALLFPLASAFCLTIASRTLDTVDIPQRKPSIEPSKLGLLTLWALLFGLATGFGRDSSGLDVGAFAGMIGHLAPAALVLFGSVLAPKRFDFKAIYTIIAPLMAIGIAIVLFSRSTPWIGQLFVSASSEGCAILIIIIACGLAYTTRSSAAFGCGILFGVECIGFIVGSTLATSEAHASTTPFIIGAILALALALVTFIVFRRDAVLLGHDGIGRLLDFDHSEALSISGFAQRSAEQYGLSPMETTVLTMLARNATRETISEELFIAPVTVRVHISRICKKMDMPSAGDLDAFIERQGLRR